MLARDLKAKLVNKKARIGVIGLGYVGLPLARGVQRQGLRHAASTSIPAA
jgi:UDP-N-acetyl-D-mannosaminuronate dehydrogenase